MHIDDMKAYLIENGENVAEIQDVKVERALELAYSYARNRLTDEVPLQTDSKIAVYMIYKQIIAGSGVAMSGFEFSQGGNSYKLENDIPYNARKILDNKKVYRCF